MSLTVRDATDRSRYEAIDHPDDAAGTENTDEGTVAGFANYRHANNQIVLTHTEVDSAYKGQGVGGQLVRAALEDICARGLRVVPECPFVKGWIERHSEYADLTGKDSSE